MGCCLGVRCILNTPFWTDGMVDKIVYGSVCSGVEAASVAWEPLGFKPAWFAEIEPFPSEVLKQRFPNVPNLGDMTKIYEKEAFQSNDIDLLVGGTPCQSFSVAGLRKGLADPRGNLALEFLRIVDTKRPRWVLWENVPGVLSSLSHDAPDSCLPPDGMEEGAEWVGEDQYDADESHAFSCFLAGLQELGYGVAYRTLDAQYFGVPQRRRRIFVVGYLGDWRPSLAVLFERGGVYGHSPKSREARKEATGAAGTRIDSSVDGIAGTVTKKWSKGSGGPAGDECYNLVTYDTTQLTSNVNSQNRKPGDPCHTLAKNGDAPLLCFVDSRRDGIRINEISPTIERQWGTGGGNVPIVQFADMPVLGLATLGHTESNGLGVGFSETANTLEKTGSANQAVILKKARRLTPMECERLQGFPDNWTLIPWKSGFSPDSLRYQAMGNSMAVPVMRWLGRRIQMVDEVIKTKNT